MTFFQVCQTGLVYLSLLLSSAALVLVLGSSLKEMFPTDTPDLTRPGISRFETKDTRNLKESFKNVSVTTPKSMPDSAESKHKS